MSDWRFAGLLAALIILHPLGGEAQTPADGTGAAPAMRAGPGINTREPRSAPGLERAQPPAAPSNAETDIAPRAGDTEPAAKQAEDAADPATPPAPSREAVRQENPPPEGDTDAPRETAPVAQPLEPSVPSEGQPGKPEQAADPVPPEVPPRPEDITLTVATWQSAYNEAQKRAMLEPFREDTGYKLDVVAHGADMAGLNAARVAGSGWDLIELDALAAARGCTEGWLARLTPSELPDSVEGDPAEADYLPGALMPCAVASAAWSAVAVYHGRAEFETAPERIADLFDLPRFPGKRAFPKQASYLLEFALMADGVAPGRVYDVLATPAGQDRALAKLSSIRHAIVWWDAPAGALAAFPAGTPDSAEDVVMGIAFNGRLFTGVVRARGALKALWDGQIYQFNYWAVPKSVPEPEAVRALLRYVSLPERQARLTQWFPYGPPRKSALPLVGRHAEIDLDMAGFVPTMPRNMQGALRFDPAWWETNGAALKRRFAAWLALPAPSAPADQLIPPTPARAERVPPSVTRQ